VTFRWAFDEQNTNARALHLTPFLTKSWSVYKKSPIYISPLPYEFASIPRLLHASLEHTLGPEAGHGVSLSAYAISGPSQANFARPFMGHSSAKLPSSFVLPRSVFHWISSSIAECGRTKSTASLFLSTRAFWTPARGPKLNLLATRTASPVSSLLVGST